MTQRAILLEQLGIAATIGPALLAFRTLFHKWNANINLSGAKTVEDIDEHIFDSLQVVPHLRARPLVLDVGSGGGFPLVVAAICLRDTRFVGLEPIHKKHAFLRTSARELGLTNLEPLAIRLENHEHPLYDAAMSRATFDLEHWLAIGATLVQPTGIVIGFEGSDRTGYPNIERFPYDLAGKRRSIVISRQGRFT